MVENGVREEVEALKEQIVYCKNSIENMKQTIANAKKEHERIERFAMSTIEGLEGNLKMCETRLKELRE